MAYLFAFSVARLLGADAWGEFSLALSLLTFGAIIGASGFDTLLLKESSSGQSKYSLGPLYRKSSLLSIGISVVIAAVLYLSATTIASIFFSSPGISLSLKIASIAIPAYTFLNINAGILQGLKQLKKYVFIRFVLHHVGGLLLFLALLLFFRGSHIVILAYTISLYLISGISYLWVRKERHIMPKDPPVFSTAIKPSRLLLIASPFMLASLLFFIKGWIDTILIGVFMDETSVGIYNIALKLTALLGITLSAVSAVSTPLYSEAYSAGDRQSLQNHVDQSSAIVFYTSFPFFLALTLFPEQILTLFGDEFRSGSKALVILAFGGFINAYFGAAGYFMKMTGSEIKLQRITFVTVVIGIILNFSLIPGFGIEGAAIATALAITGWNISCTIYIKKNYDVGVYFIPGVVRDRLKR